MKIVKGTDPLGLIAGPLAVGLVLGAERLAMLLAPCALREMTGIPCPTCGTTRSLSALASGDLATAATSNPLALIVVALASTWTVLAIARRKLELTPRDRRRLVWLVAGLTAANWLWLLIA